MKEKSTHDKRLEHMRQRRAHGLTYRQLADEFGESKSNIHRRLIPHMDYISDEFDEPKANIRRKPIAQLNYVDED